MTLIRSRGEYAEQNAGVNTKTAGMKETAGMTTSFQMPLQSTPFLWSDVKNAWRMGTASQSAFSYIQELRIRTAVLENRRKVIGMDDYIKREALRDALYDADAITMNGVKILNQFPSSDVDNVVRCRDCIGRNTWYNDTESRCAVCGMSGMYLESEDSYCSYGLRKEGN